jgi:hypothetical protein
LLKAKTLQSEIRFGMGAQRSRECTGRPACANVAQAARRRFCGTGGLKVCAGDRRRSGFIDPGLRRGTYSSGLLCGGSGVNLLAVWK